MATLFLIEPQVLMELISGFCPTATSADRFYRIDKAQVNAASLLSVLLGVPRFVDFTHLCLQEHLHFVTEICQDEVFILDHEGPVVSQGTSTGMPDLVVEPTTGYVSRERKLQRNYCK